jgi:flagellar biosynthesis protein FlhF
MQVKTFEAVSFKDAVKAVKQEFGNDAVILSTREKNAEGRPNVKIVEVTAAAANSSRSIAGASTNATSPNNTPASSARIDAAMERVEKRIDSLESRLPSARRLENLEGSVQDLKLLLLEVLRQNNSGVEQSLHPAASEVIRMLRHGGIDETLLSKLANNLSKLSAPKADSSTSAETLYRDHAIRWMLKQISISPRWETLPGGQSIHCLVGPPGAGKSTLLCKLAAQFSVREKRKVLIVSYDAVRLAASEQLRVYAKVLDIRFAAIQQPTDLPETLAKNQDCDLVLVDTTGRPVKQVKILEDLQQLKSNTPAIEFHLVLSAAEKSSVLDSAVRMYSNLGLRSLAFNKLDESWQFADAFNIGAKWGVPLSFFGTGPELPDDVERASRERVVEQIFGLSR